MRSPLSLGPLQRVALPSADLARGVEFHRDLLGLRFVARFDPPGFAFFALGDTRLLLERCDAAKPGGGVLYFRVADIAAAHAELAARGVAFDQPPRAIFADDAGTFGPAGEAEWMAFFRDPDGNTLALASRQR